jgi:hypothetical protein
MNYDLLKRFFFCQAERSRMSGLAESNVRLSEVECQAERSRSPIPVDKPSTPLRMTLCSGKNYYFLASRFLIL